MSRLSIFLSSGLMALLAACGGTGSPAPQPQGFSVEAQDTQLSMTWTMQPGVEYYLFCAPNATTIDSFTPSRTHSGWFQRINVTSPYTLGGVTNGTTYACTINGRFNGGPGGKDATPSVATPRLAGEVWSTPATTGLSGLRAAAVGTPTGASSVRYVVAGPSGGIRFSTDNASWNAPAVVPSGVGNLHALALFGGRFVAAGAAGQVLYSSDANNWTSASMGSGLPDVLALASSGSRLVAVGQSGLIRHSSDVINWTAANSVASSTHLNAVVYSPSGYWVAVGEGGVVLRSSDNAVTWTVQTTASRNLRGLAVLAISSGGTVTQRLVAVGDDGLVGFSNDGIAWTWSTIPGAPSLTTVFAGGGQYMAAGLNGMLYRSTDGTSWPFAVNTNLAQDAAVVLRHAPDNSWHLFGVNGARAIAR